MKINGFGAIVTGGASGLGGATAAMLAQAGAKVAIFDLDEAPGRAKAEAIGGRFYSVNVADDMAVAEAVADAEATNGVARILVNCAGIATSAKTVSREGKPHALDLFRTAVEINLVGTFNVTSKVAARLVAAEPVGEERGVIICTASIAAFDGQFGQSAYAASKGGVVSMTLPIARELSPHGIRVMTIAPGIFWTPMLMGLPPAAQESLGKQTPFPNRPGKPEEFSLLVQSIIGNPMLNGEVIRLDGALRMAMK